MLPAVLALLAGCDVPGLSGEQELSRSASESTITPSAGPTWHVYVPGNAPPSPDAGSGGGAGVSGGGGGYVRDSYVLPQILPYEAAAQPTPTPIQAAACGGYLYESKYNNYGVVAGVGSATVTWQKAGQPQVIEYRVAAVAEDLVPGEQPAPIWITVPRGEGCGPISGTITGLKSGARYDFWVDVVTTSVTGRTREFMIGRTPTIVVP